MTWQAKAQQHCDAKKPQSKLPENRLRYLITALKDYETDWTQWEQGFIASIEERLDDQKFISDDQCDKLEEIHDRFVK
jgi:hypothetical protein